MRRSLSIVAAALMATLLFAGVAQASASPSLQVASACLIVGGSGQRLWSENGSEERAIASTTKIMTALITLQHVSDLSQTFTQMNWTAAPQDSQIGLVPGERMSVRDLLYALLIPSADDAAMDLAYNVGGGSVSAFVAMMNAEARTLGLTHTHYSTPSGLDTPGNYSSACDLDKLANYVMAHYSFFRRVVNMSAATLTTGRYVRHVYTTDYLLGEVPWIHGIKTGGTAQAGNVLVSEGRRDGFTLIGSVLGTVSIAARDANALALLDWGYASFHETTAARHGQVLRTAAVQYSSRPVALLAGTTYTRVVADGATVRLAMHVRREPLAGPLAKATVVGQAAVQVDGRRVASVPLVLARALPKVSWLRRHRSLVLVAASLVLLALAFGAALGSVGRRRYPRPVSRRRRRVR